MTTPPLPIWYPGRSGVPGIGVASLQPQDDPFYAYTGSTALDSIAPGTVLNTRHFHYHLFGFPTLLQTTQLLYRSTSQTGKATVNVTS
ncbi:MAG TPA: triacylglycerol lipase, partial [Mycobacterium sp.]|nr:triacylglycerol lipase [Mycobacterium sp.]